jgi:hypothetical protein
MNAIIQFENHPNVAKRLRLNHFEPRLSEAGLLNNTTIMFQDYVDRNAPGAPVLPPSLTALQAFTRWEALNPVPDKTVCVFDLDAGGTTEPDSSYGLCVLLAIAQKQFGVPIGQFLQSSSHLNVFLTLYPAGLREHDGVARLPKPSCDLSELGKLWPHIRKIQNENPRRVESSDISRGIAALNQPGPRIVLANAGPDETWLAALIVNWLL